VKEFKPKIVYDRDLSWFRFVTLLAVFIDFTAVTLAVMYRHDWWNAVIGLVWIGNMLFLRYGLIRTVQDGRDNMRLLSAVLAERTREEQE
jgi:hypothetical protein